MKRTVLSTLTVLALVMITGCGSSQVSQDLSSTNPTPLAETSSLIDANYVCQNLGTIVTEYDDYLSLWRNEANNVPYEQLFTYSDEVSNKLYVLADQVSTNGIDWDSGAVVANLIAGVAENIDEISNSTQAGFFPPGRDLNALLGDRNIKANAVLNSACK